MKDVTDQRELEKQENNSRIADTTFYAKCGNREEETGENNLYNFIRDSIENPALNKQKQVRGFTLNNF